MHAVRVRCRLFARYAEVAGVEDVELEVPGPATVGDAVALLRRQLPSGHLLLSVRTHLVPHTSLLAKVTGPFNAIEVKTAAGGSFVFSGRGAGGDPTATAVLADVVELARSTGEPRVPPLGFADLLPCEAASPGEFVSAYSLRFVVRDRAGIIADLARILADHGANIEAVFQEPWDDKDALPFVITLEPVAQGALDAALKKIAGLPFHVEPPLALPLTD